MRNLLVMPGLCLLVAGCGVTPRDEAREAAGTASKSLVAGWSDADIGAVGVAGSLSLSNATLVEAGAGSDVWNLADAFHFAWQALAGDGTVVARVDGQQNTNGWAKAGVMIRESTAAGSRNAFLALTPGNGATFQWRSSTGGRTANVTLPGQAPAWVRVVRKGTLFTGQVSSDGTTWKTVGTATIKMASSTLAGLAVTSHDRRVLSQATFSSASVAAAALPPPNQPPSVTLTAPANGTTFTTPAGVALAAAAGDPDGTVARVDFFAGTTLVGTATASPFQATWTCAAAGTYSLTARATDNSGAAATSAPVSITVNAPAVGNAPALNAETFNATSSALAVRWTAPSGATAARVFLAPEPPAATGSAMPAEVQVATLAGATGQATLTGLAPAADFFLRVDVDTPQGLASQVVHGRTLGGPRATLDNPVREVHGIGPSILQVVIFNGSGSTWQAGPWTVTRGNGTAIPVTKAWRQTIPVGAPQYSVGYGLDYSDTAIDADHHVFLVLGQPLGGPDLLQVKGPSGVSFTLPFSDRYLETPSLQLNQVGYNPRATERWAYVSGYLGDGGVLSLADFPATADVLSEPADDSKPRTAVRTGLAIAVRSASDDDAGGAVDQIDLSTVPAAEGVRLRVRIPGVGVSWPTQVSEVAAFKALFTVERGLFLNRWGQDLGGVLEELPRPADHTTVFTGEITDIEGYYTSTTPQTGSRPLIGGYHDAGDFDQRPMHQVIPQVLMRAYEINPSNYKDGQLDLPESGNGVPDLLDEALWGIKAWMALQESDGGVRMGVQSYRQPNGYYHADQEPLPYWTFARDANTTARAAGLFAQMSRLIAPFNATTAADLRNRAVLAFSWAKAKAASPVFLMYGAGELFRLTADAQYDTAFQAAWNSIGAYGAFSNFTEFQLLMDDYKHPGQVCPDFFQGYLGAAGASASIKSSSLSLLTSFANTWVSNIHNSHAHRSPRPAAYQWDWGIGTGTARFMDTIYARIQLGGLSASDQQKYFNALSLASDYVLGGNPLGLVFFTLLGSRHPMEPAHLDSLAWIKEGRGPAPGVPVYGPIDSMPSASYMAPAAAVFYPAFNGLPKGLRYGDTRTLINTNEFSVWEVNGPFVELFAILSGPGFLPPASWLTGGAHVLDPLP